MLNGSPAAQLTAVDPRKLGKWDVEARIGSGGMGVVYRAVCGDEIAAVKVVRPGLLDDPQVAARFEREAQVLRSVHDTHISRFLDEDIAGTPAWLATEYIPGPNLRDAVAIWGPLSPQRWWELARGLAQALAVLEIHGIAHRDIKPANVIMSERGPVLIDFGIAHPEDAASLTATGIVTGSPAWLSPEQANLDSLTAASDVFSLGSLLAFAATGRPPFGQGATVAVLVNIQRNDPDLAGIDPTRAALLQRLLAKDPRQRPTARETLDIARRLSDEQVADSTVNLHANDVHSTQPIAPVQPVAPPVAPAPVYRAPTPAARSNRTDWRKPVVIALAALLALVVGFVGFRALDSGGTATSPDTSQEAPAPDAGQAPAFPGSNQLRSGDWLLSQYSIGQDNGKLTVDGTVVNSGDEAASTDLTVYYYIDGEPVAVATGSTGKVAAGGSTQVTLTSDDAWQPGNPVLVVEAT
ncbi:MAG: protein kinase [Candidatus Nanopelagicales bacterium]|jgi:serine/threonine protein kinase|nr:protein kinase [Candidatus Nanopelagicales bacterium]HPE13014.1 protein kinase [Actinomycetota bacterium]HPJ17979.1 protein kinase [Actinomycetota bacterium]